MGLGRRVRRRLRLRSWGVRFIPLSSSESVWKRCSFCSTVTAGISCGAEETSDLSSTCATHGARDQQCT